jgi:carbon starvation protein CstA
MISFILGVAALVLGYVVYGKIAEKVFVIRPGLQTPAVRNRLAVAIPLFAIGVLLVLFAISSADNFNIIWRYFSWSNQTMATIALWAVSAYLAKTGKLYWFTLLPAAFMTVVLTSYFFTANECLGPMMTKISGSASVTYTIGISIGLALSTALLAMFIPFIGIKQKGSIKE